MPEQKGRKRKRQRERHVRPGGAGDATAQEDGAETSRDDAAPARARRAVQPPASNVQHPATAPLPGRGVRLAGVAVGIVTAAFGVGLFYSAIISESGIDLVLRLVGGVILLALAVALGALALIPGAIRDFVQRRNESD